MILGCLRLLIQTKNQEGKEAYMKLMYIFPQYPPGKLEERQKTVLAGASPGTEIEFAEAKVDVFEVTQHKGNYMLSMLAGLQVVEKAKEAQERGFDAVLPWGTLDFGVDAARQLVDIPVVPMARTGFCLAASLASRIAVIVYLSYMIPDTWQFIRGIGFQDFVTSVRAVDMNQKEMIAQRDVLKERLIRLGKRAVEEEDAEVIITRGVSMVPVYCSAEEITREVGVPVLDLVALQVKIAEMWVSMGVGNSRKAYPTP